MYPIRQENSSPQLGNYFVSDGGAAGSYAHGILFLFLPMLGDDLAEGFGSSSNVSRKQLARRLNIAAPAEFQ